LHINKNKRWSKDTMEKVGGFLQELRGCINFVYKIKKIFYTGTREFDNVQAIYLSKIPFQN